MSVVSIATLGGYFVAYARPTASNFTDLIDTLSLPLASAADYAIDTGAADAYVMTLDPVPTAYVTGKTYAFKAVNVNTGASTLNVNGLGAKSIKKSVSTALAAGDIAAGQIVVVADRTQGDTLYYGTSGVIAALGAGTVGQLLRTGGAGANPAWWTAPLTTSYDSGQQTYANAGAVTLTHSLGAAPAIVTVSAVCTDAGGEGGYVQNEEILISPGFGGNATGGGGLSVKITSTQIVARISDEGIRACNATTGVQFNMTATKWALRFRAYL